MVSIAVRAARFFRKCGLADCKALPIAYKCSLTLIGGTKTQSTDIRSRKPVRAMVLDAFGGPDRRMVMHFPPRADYVNVHATTLHLWEADR